MNINLDPNTIDTKEEILENNLRPGTLSEFIGQERLVENLIVFVKSSLIQDRPLPHILLYGPPGLGKTTLSRIMANEMNAGIRITSGPILDKPGDIAAILSSLNDRDILFIDEIHRLKNNIEEMLYPAMEEFEIDIVMGSGLGASTLRLPLKRFTLVGATTKAGNLTSPLRARFGYEDRLDFYDIPPIKKILIRTASLLKIELKEELAEYLAHRCRGTPRIANRLLSRIKDFATVYSKGEILKDIIDQSLNAMQIDKLGLDKMDRLILKVLIDNFDGGPVGIDTIAISVGEDKRTVEEVFEPFLIKMGLLSRTSRGRVATKYAYQHLNKDKQYLSRQKSLFD